MNGHASQIAAASLALTSLGPELSHRPVEASSLSASLFSVRPSGYALGTHGLVRKGESMDDTSETHVTRDIGSGTAGEPGVAYDTDRLGEPGDPGVPTGDQYPTNERDNITEGGYGGVGIDDPPGTRPVGESVSGSEPPRGGQRGSLGDLAEDVSTSEMAATKEVAESDDPYSHGDADEKRSQKHS
jgi:hypothetical protein